MKNFFLLVPVFAGLTACGSQPTVTATNASVSEVAAATKDAIKLEPGKWQTTVKIVSIDAPGMPAATASAMKQQMSAMGSQSVEMCITPEMAAKPPENMFAGAAKNCTYEKFKMSGGKMDATLSCKNGTAGLPGDMRSEMSGTFSTTSYAVTSDTQMSMPPMPGAAPGAKMNTKTEVTGKRLGVCDKPKGV
ncbi:DUF3617 domain-containing protein (plasmid) [Sphingomonas paeninsulae]|uniref:DUF3617 domain-containing protein n=1 Tax=Sphingomonas paeninsulae TaxID=2319844 RepID=A0A494T704_SPHPE|nr:DUF3617 domain-containing protein [Sphingomonas paeninsulae]AYJ84650.1 DUF3617 domain-containing protein [Sphingomonas paeninsulae]